MTGQALDAVLQTAQLFEEVLLACGGALPDNGLHLPNVLLVSVPPRTSIKSQIPAG